MASLSLDGCVLVWGGEVASKADVYFHFGQPGREDKERQGATNQGSLVNVLTFWHEFT